MLTLCVDPVEDWNTDEVSLSLYNLEDWAELLWGTRGMFVCGRGHLHLMLYYDYE